ncbi:hypothetical protein [Enterococcus casseliflavus]|uniref:hypothetical protein n=1 Tax=Enterococcus casseliflavus TaxID=37734 RepID=UPI0003547FA2|nr:hypothetical protein [Enterococcus casseliflavus]EPH65608.1 hypothetical protein D932_00573 [Enterococcus casseliflavus 14-MB-W-14]RXA68187.1 hypothetical protein EQ870_16380 [Enterococcus casseliflavus]
MISERDVVKLKIAFPDISSTLAMQKHMYICVLKNPSCKKLVKCQTYKPLVHSDLSKPPYKYIVERKNPTRNPFDKPQTLIDLDKIFVVSGISLPLSCITTNRNNVCKDLFKSIKIQLTPTAPEEVLEASSLKALNGF